MILLFKNLTSILKSNKINRAYSKKINNDTLEHYEYNGSAELERESMWIEWNTDFTKKFGGPRPGFLN